MVRRDSVITLVIIKYIQYMALEQYFLYTINCGDYDKYLPFATGMMCFATLELGTFTPQKGPSEPHIAYPAKLTCTVSV